MSWEWLLAFYVAGTIATAIVLYLATHLGIRWQRELPKKPIHEALEVLQQRLAERQTEFDELKEQLFQAHSIIEEADRKRAYLEQNEDRIRDVERKVDQLREVEEKLAVSIDERDRVQQALQDLQVKLAASEARLQGHENILARLDGLRSEVAQRESELRQAEQALGRVREDVAREKSTLAGVEEQVRSAQAILEKTSGLHRELTGEVKQLTVERDHLQRQIHSLSAKLTEIEPADLAPLGVRTSALWTPPVLHAAGRQVAKTSTEEACLRAASARIREAGLVFHERAVNAFHTSLKVAREAPLLVLAGISGTGKSALPRRYAAAMGMHFLNVAVQPGWDSPLDLIGFYNHLEGRFKPTELARALIQMDTIGGSVRDRWPPEAKSREDLSKDLLIVLLDEMNLARVEYYFSEFLSRLEIRRDVDPHDNLRRKICELQLEVGKGKADAVQSIPLFVGENVLFVGTMNEDESTQALSDKVIDRANIMRFGRPAELHEAGPKSADKDLEALPAAAWAEWRSGVPELVAEEREQLEGWIQECNRLLDVVGRPFAHRTAQTMRAYVRQYPSFLPDRLRTAMADQVEMQVLPRLRGIDPLESSAKQALADVRRLVDRLGDDELGSAIESAAARSADQFTWTGVDRAIPEARAGVRA